MPLRECNILKLVIVREILVFGYSEKDEGAVIAYSNFL